MESQTRTELDRLFDQLIEQIPADAQLVEVVVGLHWTGVTLKVSNQLQCGLASTVVGSHAHGEVENVGQAGNLASLEPKRLATLIHNASPTERSIGLATINASLSKGYQAWNQTSALEVLLSRGKGKTIGLVGHFPFISKLRPVADRLYVFEQDPGPGELPAEMTAEILPQCQVVAITSMTLLNGSFSGLLPSLPADAFTMLLGPSTPMSAGVLELGIDMLAGTYVERIKPVMIALGQGANYRQLHAIGTRLVALETQA